MKNYLLVALMVLVAGCEQGDLPENVTKITVANPHSDRLKSLPQDLRFLGLMRAIRDSGRRCKRVVNSNYQQQHTGMAMWVAMCEDGRQWAIFVAPNADVQVRECSDMDTLDLPQCRLLTAPAAPPAKAG